MNIYLDLFNSRISIGRAGQKKVEPYYFSLSYDYPFKDVNSKIQAIEEFLEQDETKILQSEPSNNLVITDEHVAFDSVELPKLSPFKVNDVFQTRFKMSFPNFADYYVDHYLYEKKRESSLFSYSFAVKKDVNQIIDTFERRSVPIKGVDYFSNAYTNIFEDINDFPHAVLFVGEYYSELIISKNGRVLSNNIVDFGLNVLTNDPIFLDSPYFYDNVEAKKYAGFVKKSIGTKDLVNDMNISKADPDMGLKFSKPKETRILKDNSLAKYIKKNNARKLYSLICDVLDFYASDPWFLPIREIKVVTTEDMFDLLNANITEDQPLSFIKMSFDEQTFVQGKIEGNKLFNKTIKKEGRKIDWAKFFTFEIGKKKKA